MTVIRLLCVTVVVLSVRPMQAQEHATLRAMLTRAGFGDGATAAGAPDARAGSHQLRVR